MHVYTAFVTETLTDRLALEIGPPPRRESRRSEHGLVLETAVDVYMDTTVRSLGLWVQDTGFRYFGVRPWRFPRGVTRFNREYTVGRGIMIGAPMWVSRSKGTVLTVAQARLEARALLKLLPTATPYAGELDGDGILSTDYLPPRRPRSPRRERPPCTSCRR